MTKTVLKLLSISLFIFVVAASVVAVPTGGASDWPDWRGPFRDGVSHETGLPESWSPEGENLLWMAPYGGRSTPVVLNGQLYLQNGIGEGPDRRERVMCLDAATGEVIWEHISNVTLSDVPARRVGWASPAADPETGNVYSLGVDGHLVALSSHGELLWETFLSEIFGMVSTHGGRTVSPIIEGGNVIVSGVSTGWGALAPPSQRFFAFDKLSGDIIWVTSTPNRPYDTTYSPAIVRDINGTRMLIQGGSDGAVHGLKVNTGELVWSYAMSKRGINTGAVLYENKALVSHGEENLDSSIMGALTAVPADAVGGLDKGSALWTREGFMGGYSTPVLDGARLYQVDNGANLVAFDVEDGREIWRENLGTIQRASPVLADGKLYVGTQNGTFFILRPTPAGVEVLDRDELAHGDEIVDIRASVAIANGVVYLVTSNATYAIGEHRSDPAATVLLEGRSALAPGASGAVAWVEVVPKEIVMSPGDSVDFEARLFNDKAELIRTERDSAEWSMANLQGSFAAAGSFSVAADSGAQAGQVQATVDGISGTARVRVIPPLPINEDFENLQRSPGHWVNAGIKYEVRDVEGNNVYVKKADNMAIKRARSYIGVSDWHDMTVQVDMSSDLFRRRMGDAGVVAHRYELILLGSKQTLELSSWRAEPERAIVVPFPWQPDTWYTMKFRTENLSDGGVRLQGKVWPRDEVEPAEWQIDHVDPLGNRFGSPGIYADAHAEVMFDNLKVTKNQ
jgi:outer membrane protein assembly factor BamB